MILLAYEKFILLISHSLFWEIQSSANTHLTVPEFALYFFALAFD